MRRKIIALLLALIMLFGANAALAEPETEGVGAIAVIEAESGLLAFGANENEKLDPAGLARLPALLYAAQCFDSGKLAPEDKIIVSAEAAAISGPTAFIEPNEEISAELLLKAAVMISAGDAIFALAERCAGGAEAANNEISAMLAGLGVDASGFTLREGLTRMSAIELALIMRALAASPSYAACSALTYDKIAHAGGRETELANPNKLIRSLSGCFAGSTGSAKSTLYAGAFAAEREGTRYICAVLGAKDSKTRFSAASSAMEYAFASFELQSAVKAGEVVSPGVPLTGARVREVDLVAAEDARALAAKGAGWSVSIEAPEELSAPLAAGDAIGSALYSFGEGGISVRIPLTVLEDHPRAGVLDYAFLVMARWAHG